MDNPVTGSRPDPAPSRRPRDMLISLLVLVVPVLVLVGGYQVLAGRHDPVAVDPAPAVVSARHAGVAVSEPAGLGPDWVPVSAAFRAEERGGTLRLGYVTPAGAAVQLVQAAAPAASLVAGELGPDAEALGSVQVGGRAWQRYPAGAGERALVRADAGVTVLVVGPAAEEELAQLAASLVRGS